ncbi:hypothetical protein Ancab_033758 [Ancistrocladus abbreviatus]
MDMDGISLVWKANCEDIKWLKKCYVGQIFQMNQSTQIQNWIQQEGFHGCRVQSMGGKLVLLSVDNLSELKRFMESNQEKISMWLGADPNLESEGCSNKKVYLCTLGMRNSSEGSLIDGVLRWP